MVCLEDNVAQGETSVVLNVMCIHVLLSHIVIRHMKSLLKWGKIPSSSQVLVSCQIKTIVNVVSHIYFGKGNDAKGWHPM